MARIPGGRTGPGRPGSTKYLNYHKSDTKLKYKNRPVTATEYDNALMILIHHEQKKLEISKFRGYNLTQIESKLLSGRTINIKILGSRVQNFPVRFSNNSDRVYPLPEGLLAKRIARHYHYKYHKDVDTICHLLSCGCRVLDTKDKKNNDPNRQELQVLLNT